jgi:hypothetical protein
MFVAYGIEFRRMSAVAGVIRVFNFFQVIIENRYISLYVASLKMP